MNNHISLKKRNLIVTLSSALGTSATIIALSYISHIYTEIAGVKFELMSLGLTIVSAIGLVVSLFSGMLIQKTKSKMGQYRPWYLWCYVSMIIGTFMCLIHVGSMTVTFIIITVGYLITNVALDISGTAQYGIYERMSLGESDARNKLYAGWSAGANIGYTVFAAILLSLVAFFGKGDEAKGFIGAEVVIAVCVIIGVIMLLRASKSFDVDNRNVASETVESVGVKEMLGAIAGNRPLIALFIGDIFKYAGYYLFNFLIVYHCQYVLGSFAMMTIVLTGVSVIGVIASFVSPFLIKVFKGRKSTLIVMFAIGAVFYTIMAFTGATIVGFLIPFIIASFAEGVFLAVSINSYLDTGEWWYDKTGNDTRAYVMSIQAVAGKIGMLISSPLLAIALTACSFTEGVGMDAAGMVMMTRLTGLLPAAGCVIAFIMVTFIHGVKDSELEVCITRNAQNDAALYGDME